MLKNVLTLIQTAPAVMLGVAFSLLTRPGTVVAADDESIEHGRYLVEKVGMCADCHTPRNPDGSFDMSRWLGGSPLGFAPTVPMPVWAPLAPAIAGLPRFTDAQSVELLTQGHIKEVLMPRPPMPVYQMNERDAKAVVVYLRSLKPAS